jgi:hypothetical protein
MTTAEAPETDLEKEEPFVRVPGLYRDWEIPHLVEPGSVLRVEEAGEAEDGTPLFAVYRQAQPVLP